jgi:hypothetical protein
MRVSLFDGCLVFMRSMRVVWPCLDESVLFDFGRVFVCVCMRDVIVVGGCMVWCICV